MNIDRDKLIKVGLGIICAIIAIFVLTKVHEKNSMTLSEYAALHPEIAYASSEEVSGNN